MRKTEYTGDKLREQVKYLFSLAEESRNKAALYLQGCYGTRNEKYRTMKMEAGKLSREAYDLINSGQIPWVVNIGLGNNCDVSGRTTTVIARRVFDTFIDESNLSKFDGRAIELTVSVDDPLNSREYTLTFRDPETVKKVIEQLQQELVGWDDWDGGHNEI